MKGFYLEVAPNTDKKFIRSGFDFVFSDKIDDWLGMNHRIKAKKDRQRYHDLKKSKNGE